MRRVPFRTKVPAETGGGTGGSWVAQNASIPVAKTAFNQLTQEIYKAGTIVVLSKELLKIGDPGAERTVRETVAAGVSAFLDTQFLTSTITAIVDTRPAAITNGAPAVTSTGATSAAITTDLNAMLANITTAGSALVWIMRPVTAYRISATLGTAAADIPRALFGIPMILSLNSPQQITLVDASGILYSDNDGVELDTTDQATIQMDTAPVDPALATTVFESLWARNLWGVRVQRWLAYQRAVAGSVTFMTVTY